MRHRKRHHRKGLSAAKKLLIVLALCFGLLTVGAAAAWRVYTHYLQPVDVSSQRVESFTVEMGASLDEIASDLEAFGIIRSAWAFKLYVGNNNAYSDLQAGTYSLSPALSVSAIVAQLTGGQVATDMVTILPGQRLEQIRAALVNSGFGEDEVDTALNPMTHADHPVLADKPPGNNLEGYLYPETFHKGEDTTAADIVQMSLDEMEARLTPQVQEAFAAHGLSVYEGLILASIVEKEAARHEDREQIAQVFLSRLDIDMPLQADPTAHYGAYLDGAEPTVRHESPYNTYQHPGLPPTPISNVTENSLHATAYPADTNWLYFVAGDDGQTYFTRTLQEHEEATRLYCTELCPQP